MQADPLIFFLSNLMVVGLGVFLVDYLRQKGRNLATKEDLANIADRVESVRRGHEEELEKLRIELAKTVHVHKVQVELELEAYRSVWKELVSTKKATKRLRPVFDTVPENEEERWKKRLKNFRETFGAFRDAMDRWRPFYPAPVFDHLEGIARIYQEEAIDYEVMGRPGRQKDVEYWEDAQENLETMAQKIDGACEAIRDRIRSLSVVHE